MSPIRLRWINVRWPHLSHDEVAKADYEDWTMQTGRLAAMEFVRALCVLALVFLNLAHQPAIAAPLPQDVLTASVNLSYCGAPLADDAGHAPCHACRLGSGADLPPAIALPMPPSAPAGRLAVFTSDFGTARPAPRPGGARAPPSA